MVVSHGIGRLRELFVVWQGVRLVFLQNNSTHFTRLCTRAMIGTHPPFYPATKMSQNGRVNQNLSEGEPNQA